MPARPIHRFGAADHLFRGARAGALSGLAAGDVALFGLASHEPMARAVRDASWFAPERGSVPALADLGDADAPAAAIAAAISARGSFACLLGGGPADAAAVARASAADATILLSARLDIDPGSLAGPGLAIGVHDLLPARSMRAWREAGGVAVPATGDGAFVARVRVAMDGLAGASSAAVILDLGVIDAGHASGCEVANIGGLSARDVLEAMGALASRMRIVASSVTGLAPERDPRGHGELVAAEAIAIAASSLHARGAA